MTALYAIAKFGRAEDALRAMICLFTFVGDGITAHWFAISAGDPQSIDVPQLVDGRQSLRNFFFRGLEKHHLTGE